eukprot:12678960-Alexandrium_andersonii.AAC.1
MVGPFTADIAHGLEVVEQSSVCFGFVVLRLLKGVVLPFYAFRARTSVRRRASERLGSSGNRARPGGANLSLR